MPGQAVLYPSPRSLGAPVADRPRPRATFSILAVDSHELVLLGFRALFSTQAWAGRYWEAADAPRARAVARQHEPDVALVDLQLEDESPAKLCKEIHQCSPETKLLLLSLTDTISARSARVMGAAGSVPKNWASRDIAGAVRMVGLGMCFFAQPAAPGPHILSGREHQVLEMIADGSTNREIGERLFLSTNTIKGHTRTLFKKLPARNRAEAILRGQALGLLF
jgi:DNA-binding NarL/FixJ family response regulator